MKAGRRPFPPGPTLSEEIELAQLDAEIPVLREAYYKAYERRIYIKRLIRLRRRAAEVRKIQSDCAIERRRREREATAGRSESDSDVRGPMVSSGLP
jgi:hypothetical protein